MTPAALDCLGIGALLAYLIRNPLPTSTQRLANLLILSGICGYAVTFVSSRIHAFDQTFLSFCFCWLVWKASLGFTGLFGGFLQWRPIAYLGKISYGIYVLHAFAYPFWLWALYSAPLPGYRVFSRLHLSPGIYLHPVTTHLMQAAITVLFAALSWHFYEKPLNNLKRYFPYSRRQT